ncbi:MAG: hypothetical protein EBV03_06335 [Proteobacteria bacterium]|nr:hypothetical protein [Pseudomonadota bacterium]
MTKTHLPTLLIALLLACGCERVGKDEWSDIDYARIAKENYQRQNDSYYTPPSVLGCVDDDLYNCRTRRGY